MLYLFLDGQYHAARQGTDEKEGVLSAYAILGGRAPGTFASRSWSPRVLLRVAEFSAGPWWREGCRIRCW